MHPRFLNTALLAAATAACGGGTITPPPTPESARIEVAIANGRSRTLEAFTAEDLAVAASQGDVIESMPVSIATSVFVTYRALILPDRVILSGVVRNEQGRALGQYLTGMALTAGDEPLHSAMTGVLGEAWARLERVAARLRT